MILYKRGEISNVTETLADTDNNDMLKIDLENSNLK
jgi:hypothetical protein